MENAKPKPLDIGVKWALIYLITSIVITYLFQFLNLDMNSGIRYVNYIPLIAFLLLAQKECKDKSGGYVSFGDAFMPGLWYSLFSAFFSAIFVYVYAAFLNPDFVNKMVAATQTQMEAKSAPSEQTAAATEMIRNHGALFASIGTLLVLAIVGIIVALIGAAIFKKERSITDIENNASNYSDPAV